VTTIAKEPTLLSLLVAAVRARQESGKPASFAAVECTMRGGEMSPLHAHDRDEAFYVLEGVMTIRCGEDTVRLTVDQTFLAPGGVAHTQRAESDELRYLAVTSVSSVGRYEDFLRAVAQPRGDSSPDDMAALTAIGQACGITVLGPPGALPSV
jgi:mannose-6-phosphate isomerase-like protein (cupin superfamily)